MRADGRLLLLLLPCLVLGTAECRRESVSTGLELRAAPREIRAESSPPGASRAEPRRVASGPKVLRTALSQSNAHGVRLDRGGVRVPLAAPELGQGRRVHLTMRDCITDVPPGINYQVFLGEPTREHYVGGMTFFDAVHRRVTDRFGDVTEIAERIAAEGAPWEVTIVPVGTASRAAHPTVGDVLLVSR